MPQELMHLPARRLIVRISLIIFLIFAAIWSWFVIRWYIGNLLAEAMGSTSGNVELAQTAVSLAPNDPLTHWRLAGVTQSSFPSKLEEAIPKYERAVALSPHDYRFWTTLGIAYEQAGNREKAEAALRRAVSLAPAYAQSHWYLGNLLLRNGRYDEAFQELRTASNANEQLRPQFFTMLQQVHGSDFSSMSKAIGEDPALRASLALHLVKQQQVEDGLRLWSTLSGNAKVENTSTANEVIGTLIQSQRYHDAMLVWNDIAPTAASRVAIGRVLDGGFEELANYGPEMVFAWQVKNQPQMQTSLDPTHARNGGRSLRTVFQVRGRLTALGTTQLIPVAPNTQYELEFYQKTQKLESGSTPFIAVTNPVNGSVMVASEGAPNGDSDWQRVTLTFKTPENTQAVILSMMRGQCFESEICPIFGTVWYDDFSLKSRN